MKILELLGGLYAELKRLNDNLEQFPMIIVKSFCAVKYSPEHPE
jgi:hypothetical protein